MGMCISQNKKNTAYPYDQEPPDSDNLKHKPLPRLYFHAILSNIKIKTYPYKSATLIFKVRQGQSFTLPTKQLHSQQKLIWKINQKFGFQMTQYELRKQFLQVTIINEANRNVATVKINLFLIATGPYRQDFAILFLNGSQGRISFDLKISQVVELKIESEFAQLDLIKKHPGQEFTYSIKTITSYNGSSLESGLSYPAMILLDKTNTETQKENQQHTISLNDIVLLKRKSRSTVQIEEGGNLSWTQQGGTLPCLSTKAIASQLLNAYFQILIWKYQSSQEEATRELFAHSYVSFYKLFGIQPQIILRGGSEYQQRSITLTEKIEHEGRDYGRGQFKFKITNQPYFRQYQVCVHTQRGILKTDPIFGALEIKSQGQGQCLQLEQITQISASVQLNIILLNRLEAQEKPYRQIMRVKSSIENNLQKLFELVQKSSSPPQILYKYQSESNLIKGQKILVELGMRLTQYFQIEDPSIHDLCWLLLASLIKRGEFGLSHMGFNDKQKCDIQQGKIEEMDEKQEVATMYKLWLYKLLDFSLSSLRHKGSEQQKAFAEIFSAVAYFRIPQFRKEILRLITKDTDPQISEWRGVEFNLHEDIVQQPDVRDNSNVFSIVFDWQYHFYKCLRKNEQLQNENINLNDILGQKAWKEKFIKRGRSFFSFIKYWVSYVQRSLQGSRDIHQRYFPGYNRLLRGFFVQMKLRPILDYPPVLVQAGLKLLQNERLINPFIRILFNKVNALQPLEVLKALQFLNLFFKPLTQNQKMLPIGFNYIYFFRGIRIILESEFCLAVSEALALLYNHFSTFHVEFRRSISMFFMGKIFFNMFFHWSYSVRQVFYHLLVYKIYPDANTGHQNIKLGKFRLEDTDILRRYQEILNILIQQQQHYTKERQNPIEAIIEQPLYKKMKRKIHLRLHKNDKNIEQTKIHQKSTQYSLVYRDINEARSRINKLINTGPTWDKENNPQSTKSQQIKRHSQHNQFTYDAYKESDTQSIIFQNIIPDKEYQLPIFPQEKLKYIATYLSEFRAIQKTFTQKIELGEHNCPYLQQTIAIDKRDLRPEKIDDR